MQTKGVYIIYDVESRGIYSDAHFYSVESRGTESDGHSDAVESRGTESDGHSDIAGGMATTDLQIIYPIIFH
ncbi:MAG: hypothetical protein HXN43_06580 [Prevotella micans]|nr:hypothetical protein [Prevotella micans]